MAGQRYIAELFTERPSQWGLRGDPYLWQELHDHFIASPLPADPALLEAQLHGAFLALTGQPVGAPGYVFLERLAHGGMSSGCLSPAFWRDRLIPLLLQRQAEG